MDGSGIDILVIVLQVEVFEKDVIRIIEGILEVVLQVCVKDGIVHLVGRSVEIVIEEDAIEIDIGVLGIEVVEKVIDVRGVGDHVGCQILVIG